MVKATLTVLVALTAAASAHPPIDDYDEQEEQPPDDADDDDSPTFNMFGFDMGLGPMPVQGTSMLAMSIGLSVEHPVFKKTRVFGEYDWLWLMSRDPESLARAGSAVMVPRPEDHATGHRAGLGLRRELKGKGTGNARLFLDGELGGSVALINDNRTGVAVVPAGFAGVRVGYDLYSRSDDSPSRTFETGILMRVLVMPDGVGAMFGIGMFWGN